MRGVSSQSPNAPSRESSDLQSLFKLERELPSAPPPEKLRRRQLEAKPIVDAFFAWCDDESLEVLDETPISKTIGDARNQRAALRQFLTDATFPSRTTIPKTSSLQVAPAFSAEAPRPPVSIRRECVRSLRS